MLCQQPGIFIFRFHIFIWGDEMKINKKSLAISVAVPLIVGAVSGLISADATESFGSVNQPPLSPPGWLFPVVWTVLYILMGIASYLVYESDVSKKEKATALAFYDAQLAFNFFWSILFFNFELYFFSFFWLIVMLALIIVTTVLFFGISKTSAYFMLPYIVWVIFAGYLNIGVALLN